jgi:TonB family protein
VNLPLDGVLMNRYFSNNSMNRAFGEFLENRLYRGILLSFLLHASIFGIAMGLIAWGEAHAEYKTNIDLSATPLLTLQNKVIPPPPPEPWVIAKKGKAPPPPKVLPTPTPEAAPMMVASRLPSLVGGFIDENDYPTEMRKQKKEGRVIVELLINIEGRVDKVTILQGADPSFNQVVLDKLKDARFRPALDKMGEPMNCRVRLPVAFKLD